MKEAFDHRWEIMLPPLAMDRYAGTARTAKDAFAKAIEWHVVGKLSDVSINDGRRNYSIAEFPSVMVLAEIAETVKGGRTKE